MKNVPLNDNQPVMLIFWPRDVVKRFKTVATINMRFVNSSLSYVRAMLRLKIQAEDFFRRCVSSLC
jgi:hypothetical protein